MKLPLAWLRDYLDIEPDADRVAEHLAQLGFPVDDIARRIPMRGVLAGRLVRVAPHPNADRLQVCTVDVGADDELTIATAATNVAQGQTVPVATVGSVVVRKDESGAFAPFDIAGRTMRGVASQGMLCSAEELGLEGAWFEDGIMQLGDEFAPGDDLVALLRLNDAVLDVEVTANRVDAMSILGLARELGAAARTPLRLPELAPSPQSAAPGIDVQLESPDCVQFVATLFDDVAVRPASVWMRVRLALAGQRPISNLVDISNFVMLETAQPLHFFDADRIAGNRLIVRDARAGECLRTLDGEERALPPGILVVADESGPAGIAGIKGGASSEITTNTRRLLLEAATFTGTRIRRAGIALGLRTDASSRHEKGLPPGLGPYAAARAAYLLDKEGARVAGSATFGAAPPAPKAVHVAMSEIRRVLGITPAASECSDALRSLGFVVEDGANDALEVTPPFWRRDVRIAVDVIEEIARTLGYDRIPPSQPPIFEQSVSSAAYELERRIATAFAALAYREAISLALQGDAVRRGYVDAGIALPGEAVEIVNPLSEDQRYLRFSLVPGLLALVARYETLGTLRFFEIGHVFGAGAEPGADPFETPMVAWILATARRDEPVWRDDGFLTFKGEALAALRALCGVTATAVTGAHAGLHRGKTAMLLVDGKDVATIGAVDPRLLAAYGIASSVYVGLARLADVPAYRLPQFKAPSRYPAVERDLALIVGPDVAAMDVEHAVRMGGGSVVAGVTVFDEYRGPQVEDGKKSLAVRIVLQRDDATLTDGEVERHLAAILDSLRERTGAKIRA